MVALKQMKKPQGPVKIEDIEPQDWTQLSFFSFLTCMNVIKTEHFGNQINIKPPKGMEQS